MPDSVDLELLACTPLPVQSANFNQQCVIPYGCTADHIRRAMEDFIEFLGFINLQLHGRKLDRLESMIMPANFSSLVGEFMHTAITKYCPTLVKNQYHNGHPDLVPIGVYPNNAVLHGTEGIEIKASRHASGWQGHNPEDIWLLVFVFDSNSQKEKQLGIAPRPFRFVSVLGAQLSKTDWGMSGRGPNSRRTPTASVLKCGSEKMAMNWIYRI